MTFRLATKYVFDEADLVEGRLEEALRPMMAEFGESLVAGIRDAGGLAIVQLGEVHGHRTDAIHDKHVVSFEAYINGLKLPGSLPVCEFCKLNTRHRK